MTLCSHPERLRFQSTCPARGTTPTAQPSPQLCLISIHVPREGHDADVLHYTGYKLPISIHVPREGHDPLGLVAAVKGMAISIHVPREGHDGRADVDATTLADFNPRAPRGARPLPGKTPYVARIISIHVPREGHDNHITDTTYCDGLFQSTCPARGTTRRIWLFSANSADFNPRAPRGARHCMPFKRVES